MNATKRIGGAVAALLLLALLVGDVDAHGRRNAYPPGPMLNVVLQVTHPKTCCPIPVAVCVPACCQGPPCVRFQRTLFGHGKTVFTWSCGYEVTVRFTHGGGYRVIQRD